MISILQRICRYFIIIPLSSCRNKYIRFCLIFQLHQLSGIKNLFHAPSVSLCPYLLQYPSALTLPDKRIDKNSILHPKNRNYCRWDPYRIFGITDQNHIVDLSDCISIEQSATKSEGDFIIPLGY